MCANSGDVGYCLTASAQQSLDAETETLIAVGFSHIDHGNDAGFNVSPTMRANGGYGKNSGTHLSIATPAAVRRLTPVECERLQGFPDGWTQVPYRNKPAADGPRYKAIGNSWATNCAEWIGERIAIVDQWGTAAREQEQSA